MRLFKLIVGGLVTIAAALMITYWPYNFVELMEPSYSISWTKNPYGKPIRNSFTGERSDAFHFTESTTHWDLAGEVVLDWQNDYVLPWAHWYSLCAGSHIAAITSMDGNARVIGYYPSKKTARLAIIMFHMRLTGKFRFYAVPIEPLERHDI